MSNQISTREAHLARAIAQALDKTDWHKFVPVARNAIAIAEGKKAETLVELFPGYSPQK